VGTAAVLGSERPPNIVLILADDLGWNDVGWHGRTEWSTPNLERLAARGLKLERFYTSAVVCAPSRAAILTGRDTIHNGVTRNGDDLPAGALTIAEALHARGYATGLFGKWHHGQRRGAGPTNQTRKEDDYVHPMDQGFDEFFGFTDAVHAWEKFPKDLWDGRERKPVSGHSDDLFADRAIAFARKYRDRPFFLYVPFIATHFNIEAPAEDVARFRGKLPERDPSKPLNATYAAMATRLDANVGHVVQALDDLGLASQTLIVFSSDHGATFERGNQGTSNALDSNFPFRGQKRTLWEGGVRVPTLVCWPGHIPAGGTSSAIGKTTDLFPTFLTASGASIDPAWHIDGVNLLPVWTGQAQAPERTLFWEWRNEGSNQLAALRGDLKLVVTNGGRPELFNVVADPGERRNIVADYPELAKELRGALDAWLATEVSP
jgi:arylsulfatase A-like enzyme